ncbi:MAG TPA: YidC/Oxa1 family membrane protein insertase, partial [Dehalococcoidia bacterium]|nr:YidC/Oxa1 family membrane protein insertase [Dehalococcoidia bacterium]
REHNINPLGCFLPMAIQMVVFIALYRALVHLVGGSPESLVGLSERLYPLPLLASRIPLEQHFLWLNLGKADTTFILPLLVGLSTYVQQRLAQTPAANQQQQQQQQMMMWMMPLMMVWITLALPSGTGLYWVTSNIFSVFASYYVYGRRAVSWRHIFLPVPAQTPAAGRQRADESSSKKEEEEATEEPALTASSPGKARGSHGKRRGKRKNRR